MEFNVELLEEIILGISSLENEDHADTYSIEEGGKSIDVGSPLNHAVVSARKDVTGRESLRLNPSQLIEARSATQTGATPRTATEREIVEKTTARTPRTNTTPRGTGNLTPRGSSHAEDPKARKAKTLFDELCGKTGLENAMKWFEAHAVPLDREMSEGQFMQFIQSLTKFYEWEVYEILDILGTQAPLRSKPISGHRQTNLLRLFPRPPTHGHHHLGRFLHHLVPLHRILLKTTHKIPLQAWNDRLPIPPRPCDQAPQLRALLPAWLPRGAL